MSTFTGPGAPCTGCGVMVVAVLDGHGLTLREGKVAISSKIRHTAERCAENRAREAGEPPSVAARLDALHRCAKSVQTTSAERDGRRIVKVSILQEGASDWFNFEGESYGEALDKLYGWLPDEQRPEV